MWHGPVPRVTSAGVLRSSIGALTSSFSKAFGPKGSDAKGGGGGGGGGAGATAAATVVAEAAVAEAAAAAAAAGRGDAAAGGRAAAASAPEGWAAGTCVFYCGSDFTFASSGNRASGP